MDTLVTDTIEEAKAQARLAFPELTTEETAWLTIAAYNMAIRDVVPEPFVPVFLGTSGEHLRDLEARYNDERANASS